MPASPGTGARSSPLPTHRAPRSRARRAKSSAGCSRVMAGGRAALGATAKPLRLAPEWRNFASRQRTTVTQGRDRGLKTRPVEGVRPIAIASREERMTIKERRSRSDGPDVAGNGLLDRRALLGRGIMFAGATVAGAGASLTGAAAEPLKDD